jgi:hypothetical protein
VWRAENLSVVGCCVLVDRGDVTFVAKARHCQEAGAAMVALVPNEDVEFVPDAGSEDTSALTIPMIMLK